MDIDRGAIAAEIERLRPCVGRQPRGRSLAWLRAIERRELFREARHMAPRDWLAVSELWALRLAHARLARPELRVAEFLREQCTDCTRTRASVC